MRPLCPDFLPCASPSLGSLFPVLDYPAPWLTRMKSKMFKASGQACCDVFFKDKECNVYDRGCDIDPRMEKPVYTPKPAKFATRPESKVRWYCAM